jgi:hypothetical protein
MSGPTANSSANHCVHCGRACHAIWRFFDYDPEHHGVKLYESSCAQCAREQDRTFTPEQAICQAIVIVGMHTGRLNAEAAR